MTNPSIRVSADVAGIQSELAKVNASAQKINDTLSSGEVGIDVRQAKSDLAGLEASSKNLVGLLGRLKDGGDDFAGVDFDGVTAALADAAKAADKLEQVLGAIGQSSGMSGAVRNAKQTADHIQRAVRAQELLGRESVKLSRQEAEAAKRKFDGWRNSGAHGTSRIKNQEFDDWIAGGWRSSSINTVDAERQRDAILRSVGVTPPNSHRPDASPGMLANFVRSGRMGAAAGALGGMAGSAMSGGGGLWGSVGGAAGSVGGAAAGMVLGGPAGAAIGMFASQLLGRMGGAVDSGIEKSGAEGATLTDLRKSLGATSVDFEQLRGQVRYFSEGLGVSYNEAAKLARSFAHTAGVVDGSDVGRETGTAIGFGRGYGIDPDASVQFFAQMRQYQQSSGDEDSRRMALRIGEAVQRGGSSARMDEVLSSIASFVQNATKSSFTTANADAYTSFMATLTGMKVPGMQANPGAAAGVMSKADAALRRGGAFGEASRTLSLAAYQNQFGDEFNALDAKLIYEQGAFGDLGNAFINAREAARVRGDVAEMGRYDRLAAKGKGKNAFGLNMDFVERQFGRNGTNTQEFLLSGANQLGMDVNEFALAYKAHKSDPGLGRLQEALTKAGISDLPNMNAGQIGVLSALANGDEKLIKDQAGKLRGLEGRAALSKPETAELDKATAPDASIDDLRKVVMRLSANHSTTADPGDKMRQQQADMANNMQKLADMLIPATIAVRDGIISLVEKIAPQSDFARNHSELRGLNSQIEGFKEDDPAERKRKEANLARAIKGRDAAQDPVERSRWSDAVDEAKLALRAGSAGGLADLRAARGVLQKKLGVPETDSLGSKSRPGAQSDTQGASTSSPKETLTAGQDAPPNVRNNNPGNIKYGPFAIAHGATGSVNGFAVFPDKETGSAAMDSLLQSYSKSGRNSVGKIIGKWAPSTENDTSKYAATVAKRLGVGVDDQLDLSDPKVASALAREMTRYEGDASAYASSDDRKAPSSAVADIEDRKLPAGGAAVGKRDGEFKVSWNGQISVADLATGRALAPPVDVVGRISAPIPATFGVA